ncbi:3719_t:CDS:2, partial [Scutellospora calospora]
MTLVSITNNNVEENKSTLPLPQINLLETNSLIDISPITYPNTNNDRLKFINPKTGFVSTYKLLATALKSSPRAVGGALRVNPFAPSPIPCHRVIAANFFIGGFDGEWFKRQHQNNAKKRNYVDSIGEDKIGCKLDRLKNEGIFFDGE